MRITPDSKYLNMLCSYVGTGCAYENIMGKPFKAVLPPELRSDGYLSLDAENRFIRRFLPIRKKKYFKRAERFPLRDFLAYNKCKCGVCVYGHFIYVDGSNYWSFFDNENDPVVCIWYIDA